MRLKRSPAQDAASAGASPLRLRLGVALILLWWAPFWALAPYIAHALSGRSNPPSVAAITTTIVVVQTIIGLLGFWVAGSQVKTIVKAAPKKRVALASIWSIFLHGEVADQTQDGVGTDTEPQRRENA